MIQPCTVHLLQQECPFENIFLHQGTGIHIPSGLFFLINKGLGFTDLISLPVYMMDTEKVLHPRSGCAALFAS